MINTTLPLILVLLSGLFEYGSLILAGNTKKLTWKWGIWVGMLTSGLAAFGFVEPKLNPEPWLTYGVGTTFMLGMVLLSYYKQYPNTSAVEKLLRMTFLREIGVGLLVVIFGVSFITLQQLDPANEKIETTINTRYDQIDSSLVRISTRQLSVLAALKRFEENSKKIDTVTIIKRIPVKEPRRRKTKTIVIHDTVLIDPKKHWWQFYK